MRVNKVKQRPSNCQLIFFQTVRRLLDRSVDMYIDKQRTWIHSKAMQIPPKAEEALKSRPYRCTRRLPTYEEEKNRGIVRQNSKNSKGRNVADL